MHIIELSRKNFDAFVCTQENSSFYQTSAYGALMAKHGYTEFYLGMVDDDNQLLAASLFIYRYEQAMLSNIKYAYAPRGFVIDYNNFALLKTFTKKLKDFLGSKNFTFVRIDPRILYCERNKHGDVITPGGKNDRIIEDLKYLGYVHQGFNRYFESTKPRLNVITYQQEKLFDHFNTETKNKIRNAARKGLSVYKGNRNDLTIFYEFVKHQKIDRPLEYYIDMYDAFHAKDMVELYLVKLDVNKCLQNMTLLYEKEEARNYALVYKIQDSTMKDKEKLVGKKMASDQLLMSHKSNLDDAIRISQGFKETEIVVGGALIIKYNKEITFYMMGYNKSFNMPVNHILRWAIMNKYSKEGYERFNLNGVTSDFNKNNHYYGLLETKIGFAGIVHEYIGEFDLVLNQANYQLYTANKTNTFAANMSSLMRFKR